METNIIHKNEPLTHDINLYKTYFKKSSEYYLRRLEQYKSGNKYTFNVFAFFFGTFWFMYRKMYKEAFIIVLIILAESFIEEWLTADFSESAISTINRITTIALGTITGLIANALYIQKAERVIIQTAQNTNDTAALIHQLEQKGGVSYRFLIIVFIAAVSLVVYFYRQNN